MNRTAETNYGRTARIAGIGYLIIIIVGIIDEFVLRSSMIVPGDGAATAGNILASEHLFRLSIAGDLVMLGADIVVGIALFLLLERVNRSLALLATAFRLAHASVYGASLVTLMNVVHLVGSDGAMAAGGSVQADTLVPLFLSAQGAGYTLGLVFFGFHCVVLGALIIKSGFIPRTLGVLLLIAAFGYLIDSFANILLPNYADYEEAIAIVFVPALIGELSFTLWLLIKGGKLGHPAAL